ncbi:MAG: hypothetical protein ACXVBH_02570 [Flavisolibacter sp.]
MTEEMIDVELENYNYPMFNDVEFRNPPWWKNNIFCDHPGAVSAWVAKD